MFENVRNFKVIIHQTKSDCGAFNFGTRPALEFSGSEYLTYQTSAPDLGRLSHDMGVAQNPGSWRVGF